MRHRSNRRRKKEDGGKRALKALAAAGAIGAGTQAYAVPVRFENPPHGEAGHFHWPVPGSAEQWLDMLLPADEQPGAYGPSSLKQWLWSYMGPYDTGEVRGGRSDWAHVQGSDTYGYFQLVGVGAGESIPSGLPWRFSGYTYHYYYGSLLSEGVPTYLGVRFDVGEGNQYGWIGVVRTGSELETFAWGFETNPGVAIAAGAAGESIPTVSEWGLFAMSLGLLAAGAWVAKKRTPQKA